MEPKTILIKIITNFEDTGIKAAKAAARSIAKELNKVNLGKQSKAVTTTNKLATALTKAATRLKSFSKSVRNFRAGLSRMSRSIGDAIRRVTLWNTIFGRMTTAILIWSAWQNVVAGFKAIANSIVQGNVSMQTAMATFTALSGGSVERGEQFIDILKRFSIATGESFNELLAGAKRLPSQIGENFQAFEKLVEIAITLSRLDPAQGLSGAFFALTNAMEGGAQGLRSLIQRFEIGTVIEFNKALEETGDTVDALGLLLSQRGLDPTRFLESTKNTFPVVVNGIRSMSEEFLRLATGPAFDGLTRTLTNLRDFLLENQAAFQGLAQAIGQRLLGGLRQFKAFLQDIILGGQELTAGNIFDFLVEKINNFIDFFFNAVSQAIMLITRLIEAFASVFGADIEIDETTKSVGSLGQATQQAAESAENLGSSTKKAASGVKKLAKAAEPIAEVFAASADAAISSLKSIGNVGKETIKQLVAGITKGLTDEQLAQVGEAILNNVIDLEGQQVAQEQSVKNIQNWVNQAEKEVRAARDKLKLFTLATSDIPERFTRARRRQIEQEIFRAEQEQRRRKEALDIARIQLKVIKEGLAAQRQILSLIKSQAQAGKSLIDRGFTPPTGDIEGFKAEVEKFQALFTDKLEPTFQRLREGFGELGAFFRGVFGADAAGPLTEMFEAGERLRDAVLSIKAGLGDISSGVGGVVSSLQELWDSVPPWAQDLILVATGSLAFTGVLALPLSITISAASGVAALLTALASPALALPVLTVVLFAEIWFGREELSKWISGERTQQLEVVLLVSALKGLEELINKAFGTAFDTSQIQQGISEGEIGLGTFGPTFSAAGLADFILGAKELLSGAEVDVEQATEEGIAKPIIGVFENIKNKVVGNSIVPDMIAGVVGLFTQLPPQIQPPLLSLSEVISTQMLRIRTNWVADWAAMAEAARTALDLQTQLSAANLGGAAAGTAGVGANALGNLSMTGRISQILKLDANETRKLMEEGTYNSILELIS